MIRVLRCDNTAALAAVVAAAKTVKLTCEGEDDEAHDCQEQGHRHVRHCEEDGQQHGAPARRQLAAVMVAQGKRKAPGTSGGKQMISIPSMQ